MATAGLPWQGTMATLAPALERNPASMPSIPLLWILSAKDDLDWARLRWIDDEQAYARPPSIRAAGW